MTAVDIRAERQKRAKLATEARALLNTAETEKRDLTAEEHEQFDRLMDEADKIDAGIERQERLDKHERRNGELDPDARGGGGERNGPDGDGEAKGEDAARAAAFRAYLTHGRAGMSPEQLRALNAGNDPEGGFLVTPMEFATELLKNVDDLVPLRGLATVEQLTEAASLGVPSLDTDLNDAEWTSEVGTGSQDDSLRFGRRELTPNPLAKRVKVSRKLLRLTNNRAENIVRERMAYKFGVAQEKAYMTGDGNKKPLGLFTASPVGISTARDSLIGASGALTLDALTADELIDAKYTLKAQYWQRSRWLFHRTVIRQIRKLKDGDGNYIWNRGLQADQPDTILEVPFVASEYVPNTISANQYVGMIGDFSFYWIVDSLAFEIQRLVELYAETNQVGFIGRLETDGMPVLEEPFVRLQVRAGARP